MFRISKMGIGFGVPTGEFRVTPLSSSNMFFDMANSGYHQHTAWGGAGNGVLAGLAACVRN
jgi:hypothetical protein